MVTVQRLFPHAAVLAPLSAPLMAASCCDCDEGGTAPGGTGEACTTEGEQRPCYSGAAATVDIGVCQRGSQTCTAGGQGTQGVGLCQAGTQSCAGGEWSTDCVGEVTPKGESCNSQDDDCDGSTDEGGVCCAPSCVSHHACGGDGCGGNCGSCSGDRWCWNGYCVWDHGNNGSETCHTICFWGGSNCVGTSSHSCSTEGIGGIDCYCW